MANEAIKDNLFGNPPGEAINFTCASGVALTKGELLSLHDPRTVSGHPTFDNGISGALPFAGVCATDKDSTEDSNTIGVWTKGIFILTAVTTAGPEGAITAGDMVCVSGPNLIRRAWGLAGTTKGVGDYVSGAIVGKALDDIAAGTTGPVAIGMY